MSSCHALRNGALIATSTKRIKQEKLSLNNANPPHPVPSYFCMIQVEMVCCDGACENLLPPTMMRYKERLSVGQRISQKGV